MPLNDKDRAKILGLSLQEYYKLVAADRSEDLVRETLVKAEDGEAEAGLDSMDLKHIAPFGDGPAVVPVRRGKPHDVKVYDANNIDIHWKKYPSNEEEKQLFYGYHIHSKDNPYGLHTHVPGGKLEGAHKHSPGNLRGAHTHAVDITELPTNMLISPNAPIYLDGDHEHLENFADGPHSHAPLTFG
jgi:hypothetical protein